MKKYDIIKECLYRYNSEVDSIIEKYSKRCRQPSLTTELFIRIISKDSYNLTKELPISVATITKLLKEIFPDRITNTTGGKVCNFLLGKFQYKWCGHCKQVKSFEDFRKNSALNYGLNAYCKTCHLETTSSTQSGRQSEYRSSKLHRTVSWANLEIIKQFYLNCPNNMEVDHIIPLQGKLVSGLHVENNLQYLTPADNSAKHNKFVIT